MIRTGVQAAFITLTSQWFKSTYHDAERRDMFAVDVYAHHNGMVVIEQHRTVVTVRPKDIDELIEKLQKAKKRAEKVA